MHRFLIVLVALQGAMATSPWVKYCGEACVNIMSAVNFPGPNTTINYWEGYCTNRMRTVSIYSSMRYYCEQEGIDAGLELFKTYCQEYGGYSSIPSWDEILHNVTESDAENWPRVELSDYQSGTSYDSPALASDTLYNIALRTMVVSNAESARWDEYGWAMFIFFAIVIGVSLIFRIAGYFTELRWRRTHIRKDTPTSLGTRFTTSLKAYITVPALIGKRVSRPYGWVTVPDRIQSLTVAAFVIINIILCSVNYPAAEVNLYYDPPMLLPLRAMADRTGVIATYNVPFIWMFATRNNVILWLTGWNFSTFITFHRWVARVSTVEAILHSFGYTAFELYYGGAAALAADAAVEYWWQGIIATCVMGVMIGLAIQPARKYAYELFLVTHILLAVLFLVALWFHLSLLTDPRLNFMYPCWAIFAFDRLVRFIKLVTTNRSIYATASYNEKADLIRLEIPVRSIIKPKPGTFYYVYGLHGWKPWESHPFTLATWSENEDGKSVRFLLQPHKGSTKKWKNVIQEQGAASNTNGPVCTTRLRMVLEGPYGTSHSFEHYNTVLFVIGGLGITVAQSHIQAILQALSNDKESTHIRNVHLVWVMRNKELFNDLYDKDIQHWITALAAHDVDLKVDIYITGTSSLSGSDEEDGSSLAHSDNMPPPPDVTEKGVAEVTQLKDGDMIMQRKIVTKAQVSSESGSDSIGMLAGRPQVGDVVVDAANTWCVRGERLAVVSCGPASLADDVRAGAATALRQGHHGLDFWSESFDW